MDKNTWNEIVKHGADVEELDWFAKRLESQTQKLLSLHNPTNHQILHFFRHNPLVKLAKV